ncbi:unnamed protein product, partial [Mesorhabditis spiculigera]
MSTTLTATVCYLDRGERFIASNRSIHTETWETRFCGDEIDRPSNSTENISDWNLLAIVRHPLERFMSGFYDKCIVRSQEPKYAHFCYGCNGSLSCFLYKLYANARKLLTTVDFDEIDFEGRHFYPQNWFCNFLQFPHMKVIRFLNSPDEQSRLRRDFLNFLKQAQVEESQLKYIEAELHLKSPHQTRDHSKLDIYLDELLGSQELLNKFMQIFYYDFVLFGFMM